MKHSLIAAAMLLTGSLGPAALGQQMPAPHLNPAAPWNRAAILAIGEKVADYHIAQLAGGSADPRMRAGNHWLLDTRGWEQGAFLIGLTTFADLSGEQRYTNMILQRGIANEWKPGDRLYHADDHMIAQTYFWARRHGAGDAAIAPVKATFDRILASPSTASLEFDRAAPKCVDRWCWCDAIFMAPASWLEMAKVTGDARYRDFAMREFWATTDYLFDPAEHLYFRDSSFFRERDARGRKRFWSRGNGWVLAGVARMIPLLPADDPARPKLVSLYRTMAARLVRLQKPNGFWSPSLLADADEYPPESSGTAFFTYGLAWGINNGLLDRAVYLPAVQRGWTALTRVVHPDGRLGWVQAIGDQPTSATYDDTHDYAVGAFLLAATEVTRLVPER
ncbi:glycosyl hydrolase family 88 [Sphingomonas naasensis]|uniref:Glycosyl hydrolase family 88 n=2 Tax=Sphingomonas naasensis TaxID=1344951 RepID=A0A4S1WP92_9SPHN|nr:glycosyl hydrolase family 88 [Sphingomonas naasensis]